MQRRSARLWLAALFAAGVLGAPPLLRAQGTGQVTGTVTTAQGAPLPGVAVTVAGTTNTAQTGQDGRYTLTGVSAGAHQVKATRIGYGEVTRQVTVVAGQAVTVNLQLEPQALALEGVVAIGYGTQTKAEVTGAIASVKADDFVEGPAQSAASLIAGKIPGLAVTQSSGDPRSSPGISLRGTTTIQGPTNPLVLIDGVPGSLNTVAPQDIEAMDVLKDGSAAAVYGSRASNGVILITTKRHRGGNPTIRYDAYTSYSTLYNQPEFLTAADYRRLIGEGYGFEDLGHTTDWQAQVLRNPLSYNHNVTLGGGANNTNYTASLTYKGTEGIFLRSDNNEKTGRINVGHSMFDGKMKVDVNLLSRLQDNFQGPSYNGAWRQALIRNPTDRIQDDAGMWQERGTYVYQNPLGLLLEESGKYESRNLRLNGTVTLRPIEPLTLSLQAGTSNSSSIGGSSTTFRHINTVNSGLNGTAARSTTNSNDNLLEFTGTFREALGKNHFTLLGGYSYQDFEDDGFSANSYDFPTDLFGENLLQTGNALQLGKAGMSSYRNSNKLIGFFSRLNYDFSNRFLLMGSLRYEGNSRFGADHKWGLFPALSGGWRIGEESFMDALPWVSDLKLRGGYGVTGIAPGSSYLSLTSYRFGSRFLYNGNWVQGISPSRNPNPDLRWERKDEINLGLDYSLFDYRLSGSLDAYQRDTRDMLYNYSVPVPPYLFGSMLANVGHMRNKGIEAQLSYDVLSGDKLSWTTGVNWSTNRNTLVSLSNDVYATADYFYAGATGEPIQQSTHRVDIGGPIGNFYGYKSVDIDDNGQWIVLSKEGERIPIASVHEDDRQVLGNGIPKHYAAWNNTVKYGNVDLSVNMRGAFAFQILNFQRMYYENPTILQYNMLKSAFDPVYGKRTVNYDLAYVSYYIENGDYWKLDNASLGYTFGDRALGITSGVLSGARVYVSGNNLLTITGYKGMDPEVGTGGLTPGSDQRDKYPTTRMFTAGIRLSF